MGARRLLALINGLSDDSAYARAKLGDLVGWSLQTELQAQTVDLLKVLAKAWGVDHDFEVTKRPASIMPEPVDNTPVVSASAITSFLEGI